MDAIPIGLSRSAPHGARDERSPLERIREALAALLGRGHEPGGAGPRPAGDALAVTVSNRGLLLGYTAGEIILGLGLLSFATVVVPIAQGIASPALAGTALAGTTGGVLLWTMFGLMASVRTVSAPEGSGHWTFHLPFVGAAMVLGGPTAGAWVGFLASIDRRELESQPWYGILANHTSIATAAVLGGVAYAFTLNGLLGLTGDRGMATFAAVILAGLVLEGVANVLALLTIKIRDGRSWGGVAALIVRDFRSEAVAEIALIWVLVIAALTVGWWAPLVVGIAVIYLATRLSTRPSVGPLGLPVRAAFLRAMDGSVGAIGRGTQPGGSLFYVNLKDFGPLVTMFGQEIGEAVLAEVARRLEAKFARRGDLRAELGSDRFAAFLVGLTTPEDACRKAEELRAEIARPVATPAGPVSVSACVGVVIASGRGVSPVSPETLLRHGEQAMLVAHDECGPEGGVHLWSPDDEPPFAASTDGAAR